MGLIACLSPIEQRLAESLATISIDSRLRHSSYKEQREGEGKGEKQTDDNVLVIPPFSVASEPSSLFEPAIKDSELLKLVIWVVGQVERLRESVSPLLSFRWAPN